MATFPFELVSPERLLFSGEVEGVVVPGTEGDFMVLKDHAPLMSALRPGVIEIDETTASKSRLFVRGGFADVSPRGLTILAEVAIPLAELDSAALDQQIKDLQEDVADAQADDARRLANEKLAHMQELRAALKM